ncbi:uncharacterized protein LOC111990153 [Quercus suber]|uniref:Ribosomal l1 domain-containing protein 1 n=1 Tax=Quercus suber TaxID=58331 RepID=A0AAW0LNL7_QUESU|nr:ribosomal L1 domain-containing protein 1-like [Quercus suber]XP_023877716.1 ribosomal L1 domain-containing protein 1-like [Quercus suber]POE79259.1 ribosomal l1 domain-containing protein 1 [Quercus suber]
MATTKPNRTQNPNPVPIPPLAPTRVSPKVIHKAVNALLKWQNTNSQSLTQKPQLLHHSDKFFYLTLTLKKIPSQPNNTSPHKIQLPHTLLSPHLPPELCLIIDDRPHSNLNKASAKSKIDSEQIPISKVLKLSELKSDFRSFEAKRKLCDSYDMFFADKRVVTLLSGLLGKPFSKKKKAPVPLDLKHNNWKEQVEKACSSALLFLGTGTCCVMKVARVSMEQKEIVENVVAAINGISEVVPRKWGGIRSLHLKLLESLALPLYQSEPEERLMIEGVKEEEAKEKGMKGERVEMQKDGNMLVEDELGIIEGEDNENGEILGSKKRKKGDKGEGVVSSESKGLKKSATAKNKDDLKENIDGLFAEQGKKQDGGIKKRKVGLALEDGNSGEKKDKRKKSGETEVKAKKGKKAAE